MDDSSFIAAIRAQPHDDTLRLAYADWLEERGDRRSEWLRIHVQLKQLVTDGRLYYPLANQQQQLECEAKIDPAWLKIVRRPPWNGTEIRDWGEFYCSLVLQPDGWDETVSKPTSAQLGKFEEESGFRLPQSYRDYVLVFGPGKLLTDWRIGAPGYERSWFYNLQMMHESVRPNESYIRRHPAEHRDRVRRCFYFCSKYKDAFGWDIAEVTDSNATEYAVYRIVEDGRVHRFADSFRGFVENALLEMLTMPDWDEEELGTPLMFELATRPSDMANPDE
jgi:uncharacterized protein (TIGR02996 family)